MNYGLTVVDDDVDSARDPDRYVIYLDRTIDRDARDAISSADKMFPSTRARARGRGSTMQRDSLSTSLPRIIPRRQRFALLIEIEVITSARARAVHRRSERR